MTTTPPTTTPQKSAYRRWYSTLHPSMQLIGLQLWLPLFFIMMFCLCYIAAFHSPSPHNVPIGFVSTSQSVTDGMSRTLGATVHIEHFYSVDAAKSAVLHGQVGVAFDGATSVLYTAHAHQVQVASILPQMLAPVFAANGITPTLDDLAPLPIWDEFGTVSLYLTLAWCIGGYMVAMFIGLMGAPLRHRTRIAVIVVGGLLISLVTNLLAGPFVGAVHGHFLPLVILAWAWIVAIGLTVNGLSYFFGRFIAVPAMVMFVFLSVPSSGAVFPAWFMPEPFAWLNNVVVGSGITEMLKRELYGVGPGFSRGIIMLICYAIIGLVLMFTGKKFSDWLRVRRILGSRTTMMADAQNANREFMIADRHKTLKHHGFVSSETGTLSVIAPELAAEERASMAEEAELAKGEKRSTADDPIFGSIGHNSGD